VALLVCQKVIYVVQVCVYDTVKDITKHSGAQVITAGNQTEVMAV